MIASADRDRIGKQIVDPTTSAQLARLRLTQKMATDIAINRGTRSMLETTLQTIHQLKQSQREHREQQAELLKHITSLELRLKEAKRQHVEMLSNLEAITQSLAQMLVVEENLRCAISPMRHLPDDILLQIFRIIAQEIDSGRNKHAARWTKPPNSKRCALLRLSGVCARWRAVIANNPSLLIAIEVWLAEEKERELQLASHWMKAGKPAHRTLFIDDWEPQHTELLRMLLGNGPTEWKAIHISMLANDANAAPWDIGTHFAREVKIFCSQDEDMNHLAPLLRQASVVVLYGTPPRWGSLPWVHLRSLTINDFASAENDNTTSFSFGSAEFTALLSAATGLTELTLNFIVDEATLVEEASPHITHPNLSFLSLHLHHFVTGKGPFGVVLSAPALQKLELISVYCLSPVEAIPFACGDRLKILCLPAMEDDEVLLAAELSKRLPDVHSLEVRGQNVDTFFVLLHTLLHHVPPLSLPLPMPKLSSLFITDTNLRGETLIELLENRLRHVQGNTPGVSAIVDIKMYNSPAVTPEHWNRVQELLREGINNTAMIIADGMEG